MGFSPWGNSSLPGQPVCEASSSGPLDAFSRLPSDDLRVSNRPAARGAEVRARVGKGAALAAEPSACLHRYHSQRTVRLRREGPDKSNHPADHRPPQKQVDQDDSRGVALIAPDNGRQEIQKNQEKQGQHRAPLSLRPRRGRHTCAPLAIDTHAPRKMFPKPENRCVPLFGFPHLQAKNIVWEYGTFVNKSIGSFIAQLA